MLGDGQRPGDTVSCAGAGEYKFVDASIEQGIEKRKRLADIVVEVFTRLFDRFAHIGVSRKMDGQPNPEAFDRPSHERRVADIAHQEGTPFHCPAVTGT